jgi:hypothetical protein
MLIQSHCEAMESWLERSGASGLHDLELADFPDTGRGVKTLRRFKQGENIFTIPHSVLWTIKHANDDPLLGPVLLSMQPSLSIDDTLITYILFVRSRTSGYDDRQSHIAALPTSYSSSIFFSEKELDICSGSSLHAITKHLIQQIELDYKKLVARLYDRHQDLFPRNKFTIDDVRKLPVYYSSVSC